MAKSYVGLAKLGALSLLVPLQLTLWKTSPCIKENGPFLVPN